MLPQFEPMLPMLVHKPFSHQEWLFEPKWDGWRATCFVRDGEARFGSRRRNSLNERFPQLRHVGENIKANTAIIDGEIVALDKNGLPRFDGLRSRRVNTSVVFYAFDLLYLELNLKAPFCNSALVFVRGPYYPGATTVNLPTGGSHNGTRSSAVSEHLR
jgi:ATP-dependent DNA ligase